VWVVEAWRMEDQLSKYGKSSKFRMRKAAPVRLIHMQSIFLSCTHKKGAIPLIPRKVFLITSFGSSLLAFQPHLQTNGFSTHPSASSLIARRCRPPTRPPTMPLTDQSMGPSSFPLPSHLDGVFSSHSPSKLRQPRISNSPLSLAAPPAKS
jgi:hypothetical protein